MNAVRSWTCLEREICITVKCPCNKQQSLRNLPDTVHTCNQVEVKLCYRPLNLLVLFEGVISQVIYLVGLRDCAVDNLLVEADPGGPGAVEISQNRHPVINQVVLWGWMCIYGPTPPPIPSTTVAGSISS